MRTFKCPRCTQSFQADEQVSRLSCPACGAEFVLHRRNPAQPAPPVSGPTAETPAPPASAPYEVSAQPELPEPVTQSPGEVDFAALSQQRVSKTYRDLAKAREKNGKKILTHVGGLLVVLVLLGGGIWLLAYRAAHPPARKEAPPQDVAASVAPVKKPKPPRPRLADSPTSQEDGAAAESSVTPSAPSGEPAATPAVVDPNVKPVSDPAAIKLDFTNLKLEPWDMYDETDRRLSARVTSQEAGMIVAAKVKATFYNQAGVAFRRSGEGQDPDITFPIEFIPPKGSFVFYVKLMNVNPAEELAIDKTTFKVVSCRVKDKAQAVKVDDVKYRLAEGDRPALVTGTVLNDSPDRLLDVKVRVEIVESRTRPPVVLEGGLTTGGVMAPNGTGKFEFEVKLPVIGDDLILQSPRGYGEIMTSGPGKASQKD